MLTELYHLSSVSAESKQSAGRTVTVGMHIHRPGNSQQDKQRREIGLRLAPVGRDDLWLGVAPPTAQPPFDFFLFHRFSSARPSIDRPDETHASEAQTLYSLLFP